MEVQRDDPGPAVAQSADLLWVRAVSSGVPERDLAQDVLGRLSEYAVLLRTDRRRWKEHRISTEAFAAGVDRFIEVILAAARAVPAIPTEPDGNDRLAEPGTDRAAAHESSVAASSVDMSGFGGGV